MRKYVTASLLFFFVVFLLNTPSVRAHMEPATGDENASSEVVVKDEGHGESIEALLQALLAKQKVDTISALNCDQVSDSELERLGDAVMEQQHPGAAHGMMDRMMGGEGSESLREMHINRGSNYLGCRDGAASGMMSGGGMMARLFGGQGLGSMMGGGMMGGYGIFAGLTWITLIAFLLAGVYFFLKQANKK